MSHNNITGDRIMTRHAIPSYLDNYDRIFKKPGRQIAYWPDGCWCERDEITEMRHRGDDFGITTVPEDAEEHDIYATVLELIS